MSYSYKTVLRREGFDFDVYQNRHNSKVSGIIAINKKDCSEVISVGLIYNKSGVVEITEEAENKFSNKTITDLKNKL